jgi:selenocysteine-specific elongation factor
MILGTAGHIDHGKTTLVHALTGVDTDRLPEEKRRGITIELGFAPLVVSGVGTIGIVDVPGHEAFVRTMLAGATGIDLALLVVAADESVMPQTREHLAILGLLGVRAGVVALTKCDLVDDEWRELVVEDVRALVTGTVLARAPIVATSAATGEGLDALRDAVATAARALPVRDGDDLFRMPIDRAFTIKGTGTVVTGTVWSGRLSRDATVRVLPADRVVRVRGLQSHGAHVDVAEPGHRTAVALAGVEVGDVGRGSMLVADPAWRPTSVLRADVALLADAPQPLRARTSVRFHLGTSEVGARVVVPNGGLAPGERRGARVVLDAPVVVRAGDRFVLRAASPAATIGGGIVVDPFASRRARPWAEGAHSPALRLDRALTDAAESGIDVDTLTIRLGAPPDAVTRLVAERKDAVVRVGARLYARPTLDVLESRLVAMLAESHRGHPLEPGMSLQHVRSRLSDSVDLADHVIAHASRRGLVETAGGNIRAAGWVPRLSSAQRQSAERIFETLNAARDEPPSAAEVAEKFGTESGDLLRVLEREGRVVQVEPERYYAVARLTSLVDRLRQGMQRGREYAPSELRDLLGFSRKFLIPFLEYCDRQGLTARGESGRSWRGT